MPQDPQDPQDPTAEELAENLRAGLAALPKGREATDAVYDEIQAKRRKRESSPAKSSDADRPEFWREGEPMPDWAEESVKLADRHRNTPAE